MNYNLVFFGVKDTSRTVIESLTEKGIKIDLIVTISEETASRNHISGLTDLSATADKLKTDIYLAEDYSLNSDKDKAFFEDNSFKTGIVVGWQRIIPEGVLLSFADGVYGFHGSCGYLPFGRGRSPLNWSIIKGDRRFVNHLFKYTPKPDWGDVFSTQTFEINAFDDIRTLQYKAMLCYIRQISSMLKNPDSGLGKKLIFDQNADSWYKKRTPEDGKISFTMRTREIYNLVRAVTKPFPGAFCMLNGKKMMIYKLQPFEGFMDFYEYANGQVIDVFDDNIVVKTLDGSILITDYEYNGKIKKGDMLN